ncbi:MAG: 3-dehydroquinate synthase, partial [Bacteroidales bacterium]
LKQTADYVRNHYGPLYITCKQYDQLNEYMTHDKKNDSDRINFTLLRNIGEIEINQHTTRDNLDIMFDIYRDLMQI